MSKAWWPATTGLPIVVCLTVFWLAVGLRDVRDLQGPVLSGVFADALLATAAVSMVCAPLLGVALARRATTTASFFRQLAALVLAFVAVSALLGLIGHAVPGGSSHLMKAHIALGAGSLALGALGGLCAVSFRDPLDAAAVSVGVAVIAGAGVLIGGPGVTDIPRAVVDAALLASPLVTTAAASGIDILRTDVFYRVSPLAHIGSEYSEWYAASAAYLTFTAACLLSTALIRRRSSTRSPSERSVVR